MASRYTQGNPSSFHLIYPQSPAPAMTASGNIPLVHPFKFCQRRERMDWRQINAFDIDLMVSQEDVNLLREHINMVTFGSLEGECCLRCRYPVDPALMKLLKLAQLSLEWLLHSQKVLTEQLHASKEWLAVASTEHQKMLGQLNKKEKKEKALVLELKHRKKIIRSQQSQFASEIISSEKCQHCEKFFLSSSLLQNHMKRRHPKQYDIQWVSDTKNKSVAIDLKSENDSLKLENDSLKSEVGRLKEQIDQQRQDFEAKIENQKIEHQSQKDLLTKRCVKAEMMAQMEKKTEDNRDGMLRKMEFFDNQNTQDLSVVNQNQHVRHEKRVSPVHLESESNVDSNREIKTDQMLVQKMKKQEKTWKSTLEEMKVLHDSEKNTLLDLLSIMQIYESENQEIRQKLQEKTKIIRAQRKKIKSIKSNSLISSPAPEELIEEEEVICAQRKPVIVSSPIPEELSEEEEVICAQKEPVIVSSPAPDKLSEEEDSRSMSEKRPAGRLPEPEVRKKLEQMVVGQLESQRKKASRSLTDKTPPKTPPLSSIEKPCSELEKEEPIEHLRSQSPQPSRSQVDNSTKTKSHEDLEIDPQQLQSLGDQNSNTENRDQKQKKKTNKVVRKMQKMAQKWKQFWSRRRRSTVEEPEPAPASLSDAGTGSTLNSSLDSLSDISDS
ncbi:zinc finger protein Dzip1-like [Gouania willdenowi]|uniref:Zinc finger protein Dzip1-like n=1 Tax=Gouania willdenowi TaxID=441366 RepID=A0A8C5E873_GOUWI|nr:zinc finger protein Dzip1-like [Gouania willdenowi]